MANVTLEKVVKRFGDVTAVREFDLEIADGEFVVLVGPSGCGKSTTLRMVAGLEPLSDGTIRFGDEIVNDYEPKERDIAMVFQSYALYPHMTVFGNMAFGLRLQKTSKEVVRRRVEEAANLLNISELLERRPRELSGGQRQRVAMGRAIVRHPKVFLFDEPLSNLDAALRSQMRVEIKRLHAKLKTTVIYVTHDQIEAMTLADRIVVMREGRIEQVGPPHMVYNHPVSRFVAGFIGAPKMNFIPGELVAAGNGAFAVRLGDAGTLAVPPERQDIYRDHVGRPVELGIRPERFVVGEGAGAARPARLEIDVEVVEPTGGETLVFTSLNGAEVSAKCDPNVAIAPGDRVTVTADMSHMHLIDTDTGRVVRTNSSGAKTAPPGE